MNGIICQAIEKKKLLQFSYDDLTRIVDNSHEFLSLSAQRICGFREGIFLPHKANL
jgi:hypothetical protein